MIRQRGAARRRTLLRAAAAPLSCSVFLLAAVLAEAADVPFGVAAWDESGRRNHRAVVQISNKPMPSGCISPGAAPMRTPRRKPYWSSTLSPASD